MTDEKQQLTLSKWLGLGFCVIYHIAWVAILLGVGYNWEWDSFSSSTELATRFAFIGALAGAFYCLRSLYLHGSVHRDWGNEWIAWHLIRPITSAISSIFAFVMLKAGLIVLDSDQPASEIEQLWGFYFIALIAGLNVDKFQMKIEEMGKTLFGVEPSRMNNK